LDYPEQYPKYLVVGMRNWLDKAVKKAKKIITISNFTRSEVISKLGADENKVVMVTLGYNSDLYNLNTEPNEDNILNNMGVSGPFFVHIGGNLIERKNTDRIIQAFAKMSTQHKDLKLVIVGSSKSRGDEKETRLDQLKKLVNDLRINDKIIFPGFVTYEQLATLLRRTSCCVYPSLAEGFGLPVIEAMACGAPVITSNTSSLPEAAGNAAIMINPLDEDEIAAAMGKVLDSKTSEKLRRDGLEWVKKFSWHKTALSIKDVLEEAGK
ncbi:MAG: glycosyltransferase family 1 protein, partial [Candidatus Staskawiczbacteria bacterium]|nr:glycosyltransferase family 1 protein [Candidatus Staskawiczbacteria bacterium]